LTFSNKSNIVVWTFLKTLLLRSFQTNDTPKSHSNYIKERRFRDIPKELVNWKKWSCNVNGSTPEMPNQFLICCHMEPKYAQWINKWDDDSSCPHPAMHMTSACWRIRRLRRFNFVGNLSWSNRQARMDTFRGTWLCQTSSPAVTNIGAVW
jgi:hypothetical protein